MKVYYAAAYTAKEQARKNGQMISRWGHRVLAPWTCSEGEEGQTNRSDYARRMAEIDLGILATCDVYVEDRTLGDSRHGSMSFECGWANGRGIPCVIVGRGRGIFDYSEGVTLVADYPELDQALQKLTMTHSGKTVS